MAEKNWTEKQKQAIGSRGRTLLISAAAGSGKTATLTERIIRSLLDKEEPTSISDLLIVTFTNAAVGELRDRIAGAIKATLAKDPDNATLERQLLLLPTARIRTIDGFCNELLRVNAERVGLPPKYRIADVAEAHLLARSVMEGLINGIYEGEEPEVGSPEAFAALAVCLTGARDEEKIVDVLIDLYQKTESHEDGVDALLPLCEQLSADAVLPIEQTLSGRYILQKTDAFIQEYLTRCSTLVGKLSPTGAEGQYRDRLSQVAEMLQYLRAEHTYAERRTRLCGYVFERRPSIPAAKQTELTRAAAELYLRVKDDLDLLVGRFYSYPAEAFVALHETLHARVKVLVATLMRFDRLYGEQKRKRAICEYSDIERYAYRCLWENGERTPLAIAMSETFSAIYIDEYQDINRLQNKIFEAISRPDNRFMVGDIKQSIYRFRSADPRIFAKMKADYVPYDRSQEGDLASLFMSENFRSDDGVIGFINEVFDTVFGLLGDSIGYTAEDRLVHAKGEQVPYRPCRVFAIEAPNRSLRTLEDAEIESQTRRVSEASTIAEEICALLDGGRKNDGTPIRPGDIALILRSASGKTETYREVFMQHGIPCRVCGKQNFFLNPDVLLALCLLNAIDNPQKDIYLAGLLCSPLFGFSADDLYRIRAAAPSGTLYAALLHYEQSNPDAQSCRSFLQTLRRYRRVAEGLAVDRLLDKLYHETGLLTLATAWGGADNLLLLYEHARRFEQKGYRGLYAFISYINRLIEDGETFDDKNEPENDDEHVKIMTVHSSKGLEYPVCFVAECGAAIRDNDASSPIRYCEDFALSVKLRDPSGIAALEDPVRAVIGDRIFEELFEEELRILYVALTRAREQLYVSGVFDGDLEEKRAQIERERGGATRYSLSRKPTFLNLILSAVDGRYVTWVPKSEPAATRTESTETSEPQGRKSDATADAELVERLRARFAYRYPHEVLTTLPEKLSVSSLSPGVLDGNEPSDEELSLTIDRDTTAPVSKKEGYLPKFYTGVAEDEGARRGTATHMYLQFCDFAALAQNGAAAECDALVEKKFLSREDAALVRLDEVERFARSALMTELLAARTCHRELRFHVRLPAKLFTDDPTKKERLGDRKLLIQGVIDCIFETSAGEWILIDYKTDRVPTATEEDRLRAEETLKNRHERQLFYYRLAVRELFGRYPDRIALYSLALGRCVWLTF